MSELTTLPVAAGLWQARRLHEMMMETISGSGDEAGSLDTLCEPRMFKEEETIMNEQIKKAIRQRARRAVSKDDLVRAVFDSFRSQQIELRNVSLEDMKAALVEAARAAKEQSAAA